MREAGTPGGRAVKVVVSVDTEADDQWTHGAPLSTRNVGYWQPFQALCERYGSAGHLPHHQRDRLRCSRRRVCSPPGSERGSAEVGAHLHPWTTPPFADAPGLRHNDPVHAFAGRLDDGLLRAKLETLTDTGRRGDRTSTDVVQGGAVRSERSRPAAPRRHLDSSVDSSVTPVPCSWSSRRRSGRRVGLESGPDFRGYELGAVPRGRQRDAGARRAAAHHPADHGPRSALPGLAALLRCAPRARSASRGARRAGRAAALAAHRSPCGCVLTPSTISTRWMQSWPRPSGRACRTLCSCSTRAS